MGLPNKLNLKRKKELQREVKRQRALAKLIHEALSQGDLTVREAQVMLQVVSSQIENAFYLKRLKETLGSLELEITDKDENKTKAYAGLLEALSGEHIQTATDLIKGFLNAVDGQIALENTKRNYTELELDLLE